jgi:hypothetical protein
VPYFLACLSLGLINLSHKVSFDDDNGNGNGNGNEKDKKINVDDDVGLRCC